MLPQSYQHRNLSEGADRIGGQLRGDKEYPFSGVTKSGRVWRKVSESDTRIGAAEEGLYFCVRGTPTSGRQYRKVLYLFNAQDMLNTYGTCLLFQIALPDDSTVFKEES